MNTENENHARKRMPLHKRIEIICLVIFLFSVFVKAIGEQSMSWLVVIIPAIVGIIAPVIARVCVASIEAEENKSNK